MCWLTYLNTTMEDLAFDVNHGHISATHFDLQTCEISYLTSGYILQNKKKSYFP
jgi:hypothetical protein